MKSCGDESFSSVTIDTDLRDIVVAGSINYDTASKVLYGLRQLESLGKSNINLLIASPGGEFGATVAMADAIELAKPKVIGQAFGECMSAAAFLLQACDTRYIAPSCRFMIHNAHIELGVNTFESLSKEGKELKYVTDAYCQKMASRSNLTLDQVVKLCNNETYMSAEIAVGYGFADAVLGSVKRKKNAKR